MVDSPIKRGTSLLLIFTLCFGLLFPAFPSVVAANTVFADVDSHWASQSIKSWIEKGLVKGYQDGTFKPNDSITRAEFMTLVNKAFGFTTEVATSFTDVKTSDWYYAEINKAKAAGYITGYADGTIKPNYKISRQEVAVILAKITHLGETQTTLAFRDASQLPAWSKGAVAAVVSKGFMNGYPDQTFQPVKPITRAEAVVTLDNALQSAKNAAVRYDKAGTYGQADKGKTVEGDVVVSAPGVTLRNMTITGDLLLSEGIGEGDVVLEKVVVKGVTTIQGGGPNSIKVKDSTLGKITVNKKNGKVRVEASGNTVIGEVTLASGAKLEESALTGTGFSKVVISSSVPASAVVELLASLERVQVDAASVKISLVKGSVSQLEVTAKAKDITLDTAEGTNIKELNLDSATTVTGKGKVEVANIRVNGSKFATEPQKVNLSNGVTYEIIKATPPSGGGVPTPPPTTPPTTPTPTPSNEQKLRNGEDVTGDVTVTGTGQTYGPANGTATVTGSVTISGEGNTLQNLIITGNLTISEYTAAGPLLNELAANNVTVQGNTIINGGSSNTVKFANVNLGNVAINKTGVRLALSGSSSVTGNLEVNAPVIMDVNTTAGGTISRITVNAQLTLRGDNVRITNFTISAPVTVSLMVTGTTLPVISVTASGVTLESSSTVGTTGQNVTQVTIPLSVIEAIVAISLIPSIEDLTNSVIDKELVRLARTKVNLVAAGQRDRITNLQHLLSAEAKLIQLEGDTTPPTVTAISFGSIVSRQEGSNTFAVDLRGVPNHYTTASITVSEKSNLLFDLGQLGTIGTFGLKQGVNTINDINVANLDLSGIRVENVNFTAIFNAIKDSNIDRQLVFDAVDYTTIFNEIKRVQIGGAVLDAVQFDAIIAEIKRANLQGSLYDQFELSSVFNTIKNSNVDTLSIYNAIDYPSILSAIMADNENINFLTILTAVQPGLDIAQRNGVQLSTNLSTVFSAIKELPANQQKEIYEAMNMTAIFTEVAKGSSATKTAIFNAINFTQVFNALKSADSATKLAVFNSINFTAIFDSLKNSAVSKRAIYNAINFPVIFDAIENSNINRSLILHAIDLRAIFNAVDQTNGMGLAIFRMLAALDNDNNPNVLTIQAILKDDAQNQSVYVLRIQL